VILPHTQTTRSRKTVPNRDSSDLLRQGENSHTAVKASDSHIPRLQNSRALVP
jgi:hypothetical protein